MDGRKGVCGNHKFFGEATGGIDWDRLRWFGAILIQFEAVSRWIERLFGLFWAYFLSQFEAVLRWSEVVLRWIEVVLGYGHLPPPPFLTPWNTFGWGWLMAKCIRPGMIDGQMHSAGHHGVSGNPVTLSQILSASPSSLCGGQNAPVCLFWFESFNFLSWRTARYPPISHQNFIGHTWYRGGKLKVIIFYNILKHWTWRCLCF